MPKQVTGGGEQQPPPPSDPNSTVNEQTYQLTVPLDTDVANVPGDLEELATDVARELDLRLTEAAAARSYQSKIVVVSSKPAVTAVPDGAIVFVLGT